MRLHTDAYVHISTVRKLACVHACACIRSNLSEPLSEPLCVSIRKKCLHAVDVLRRQQEDGDSRVPALKLSTVSGACIQQCATLEHLFGEEIFLRHPILGMYFRKMATDE